MWVQGGLHSTGCPFFSLGPRRKVLYQRAPRNIHRHVVLSEIKEAVAALPPDVTTQSVMGFDPLPPVDTIYSYVRPERYLYLLLFICVWL